MHNAEGKTLPLEHRLYMAMPQSSHETLTYVEEIEGKGYGVFASTELQIGQAILQDKPIAFITKSSTGPDLENIFNAVNSFIKKSQSVQTTPSERESVHRQRRANLLDRFFQLGRRATKNLCSAAIVTTEPFVYTQCSIQTSW